MTTLAASQIEFPLVTAVCAWCRPQRPGSAQGILSHGICLKHLRKLKLQALGLPLKRTSQRSEPEESARAGSLLL